MTVAWLLILTTALAVSPEAEHPDPNTPESAAPAAPDPGPPVESILCGRGEYRLDDGGKAALLEARRLFELAAEGNPESSCARSGISRAALALYQRHIQPEDETLSTAIREAEEAVRLSPRSPVAHASLATALMADLRPAEADRHAQTALELDPDSVHALQAAALVRIARHGRASAREAADRALALRPDLPALHLLDGNLHLLGGEPREAIGAYRTALLLSPDFLPAAFQEAAAYETAGDYRRAAAIFERLLQEYPGEESAIVHLYMAQSLMHRASWNAALTVLARADFKRSKGVCNGTVLHLKAICLERLGRSAEAIAVHRELLRNWPDATRSFINPERLIYASYISLGRLLAESGDLDEAVRIMEEGAGRPDASLELMIELARRYDEHKLLDQASVLLEKATARDLTESNAVDLMAAYVLWARVAARSGDRPRAQSMIASLLTRSEELARMGDFIHDVQAARAFSIAGDVGSALDSLERAVANGYTHLAWIADDPEFQAIRSSDRYAELVRSVRRN